MSNSLSNGVSVTVSTDELESKIDAVSGKFIKTLTKSQKSLKMSIDEMGRYVNASGKVVEGLSLAQIKLGQYVDEFGRVRTAEGEFVADLNKIEQALGFYADELGVVYNAQHDVVRLTAENKKETLANKAAAEKAAKELAAFAEKEAKTKAEAERIKQAAIEKTARFESEAIENAQRRAQMLGQAAGAFSQLAGQFANFLATTDQADGAVEGFRTSLAKFIELTSVGVGTFQTYYLTINGLASGLNGLKASLAGTTAASAPAAAGLAGVGVAATTASVGLKALQFASGPAGIAIATIGAGIAAFATASGSSKTQTSELSDSFKELDERAKKAGDSVRSLGDALHYGAFQTPVSEYDAAFDKIQKTAETLKNAREEAAKMIEGARYGGMGGGGYAAGYVGSAEITRAEAEQKNAWAKYTNVVKQMIATAREEQRTEIDKLAEQKRIFESIQNRTEQIKELAEKRGSAFRRSRLD